MRPLAQHSERKTKIICTIGPASERRIEELISAGMDIARINTAYTDRTYIKCGKPVIVDVRSVNRLKEIAVSKRHYVALSFVRSADCIKLAREYVPNEIIAKVETKESIENLEEIVRESDMVMIARGDLGKVFGVHSIPVLQEKIIRACERYEKPFIVATEVLKSMTENKTPTRAETIDVMYAVKRGAFGIMLAEETAIGKYPVDAVIWLDRIIATVERELIV